MNTFFIIAGIALFIELYSFIDHGPDTTDKPGKKRWWKLGCGGESGLRVYVDNATGVHYVKSSMFDKLQVRINADGTPFTNADEKP